MPSGDYTGPLNQLQIAELPRVHVDTTFPVVTGRTINVRGGDNLQAAIDVANPGDEVVLEAGATFNGPITLPDKPGDGWIVIRSSGELPSTGTRATASDAGSMARIVASTTESAISTEPSAHHYRLVGLEVTAAPTLKQSYDLIRFGSGDATQNLENMPHDLILDRCYVHGTADLDLRRGVALNSGSAAIIDSTISEAHSAGFDSQAVAGWNGSGPYLIKNNYLEGAGENLVFGGADPSVPGLLPSDIEIIGNHLYKPPSWQGVWLVKNLFELKIGHRILAEGNILENNWVDGQDGFAVVFKTTHQGNTAPWSQTADVTFRDNIVMNSPGGINIAARPEQYDALPAARFVVSNNLFSGIGEYAGTKNGRLFQLLGANAPLADVLIEHNTAIHNTAEGTALMLWGDHIEHLVFRDNIVSLAQYGIFGGGVGEGASALAVYAPDAIFTGNLLIGSSDEYGELSSSNLLVGNVEDVGFADPKTSNFSLTASSKFIGIGANSTQLPSYDTPVSGSSNVSPSPQPVVTPIGEHPVGPAADPTNDDNTIYGTAFSDTLVGGSGNDILFGLDGNDILSGGFGVDRLNGGAGLDFAYYGDASYKMVVSLSLPKSNTGLSKGDVLKGIEGIITGSGNDIVSGDARYNAFFSGSGADKVFGMGGNDTLSGGPGADTLDGGAGYDFADYSETTANLTVALASPLINTGVAKNDKLISVEGVISGSGSDKIFGDAQGNKIYGSRGDDRLSGLDGNDTLCGGVGKDVLTGGNGADAFLFDTVPSTREFDIVRDFSIMDDRIQMKRLAFTAFSKVGTLKSEDFFIGSKAHDSTDHVIYNFKTGELYYDPDGNGANSQIKLAELPRSLDLHHAEFVIV